MWHNFPRGGAPPAVGMPLYGSCGGGDRERSRSPMAPKRMVSPAEFLGRRVPRSPCRGPQALPAPATADTHPETYKKHPWCYLGPRCQGIRLPDDQLVRQCWVDSGSEDDGLEAEDAVLFGAFYCTRCWFERKILEPDVKGILDHDDNFGFSYSNPQEPANGESSVSSEWHVGSGSPAVMDSMDHGGGYTDGDAGQVEGDMEGYPSGPSGYVGYYDSDGQQGQADTSDYGYQGADEQPAEPPVDFHDIDSSGGSNSDGHANDDGPGHWLCVQGKSCIGALESPLVRHIMPRTDGGGFDEMSVYCVPCWKDLMAKKDSSAPNQWAKPWDPFPEGLDDEQN